MYSASLSKCSLKAPQCRLLAALLLNNPTEAQWKAQILAENLLQMRAPGASLTIASHLRQRLQIVSREVQVLIRDGDAPLSTQGTFAAALKHSALLRDFMDLQIREELRLFHPALSVRSWDEFFAGCRVRDPSIEKWSAPVVAKLGQNVFRMLAEVGILANTQTKQLQKVSWYPELVAVLERDGEEVVLRALRVSAV
jgi:hypothetical protein